jgi:hypothetical protein
MGSLFFYMKFLPLLIYYLTLNIDRISFEIKSTSIKQSKLTSFITSDIPLEFK